MTRSSRARWFGFWVAAFVLAVLAGCGGPESVAPSPTIPTDVENAGQAKAAPVASLPTPTRPVTFPAKWSYKTFANRGIEGWKVQAEATGKSVSCSFRSASGAGAHYGGVGLPVEGSTPFGLSVKFSQGADAVRAVFVTALDEDSAEYGRWGYDVAKSKAHLTDGEAYSWAFARGQAPPPHFWGMAGVSGSHNVVHLFVDVAPSRKVEFTVEGALM